MTMLYSNPGPTTVYIGGRAIPPGEAREVDAALIPPERTHPPGDDVPFAEAVALGIVAGEPMEQDTTPDDSDDSDEPDAG